MQFIQTAKDITCLNCEINSVNENSIKIIPIIETKSSVADIVNSTRTQNPLHALLDATYAPSLSKQHNTARIVTKTIDVTSNAVYMLTLDANFILFTNNEDYAPVATITIVGVPSSWHHTINSKLTSKYPIVCSQFFIPSYVKRIQIEIQIEFSVDIPIPYHLDVQIQNCVLQLNETSTNLEKSWQVSKTPTLTSSSSSGSQAKLVSTLNSSNIYNLVEHVYLFKLPSTNAGGSIDLENWACRNGIVLQPIYHNNNNNTISNHANVELNVKTCSHCFYEAKTTTGIVPQNTVKSDSQDNLVVAQMMTRALMDALDSNRSSILLLQDSTIPHYQYHQLLTQQLEQLPRKDWNYILLGANHLNNKLTSNHNPKLWVELDDHHIQSDFALAIQGSENIEKLLSFLQEAEQQHLDPLLGLHFFLIQQGKTFVCQPNLFILRSDSPFILQQQQQQQPSGLLFDNLNPAHWMAWRRTDYYEPQNELNYWWNKTFNIRAQTMIHIIAAVNLPTTTTKSFNSITTKLETILQTWQQIEALIQDLKTQSYQRWKLHVYLPLEFKTENDENKNNILSSELVDVEYVESTELIPTIKKTLSAADIRDSVQLIRWNECSLPTRLHRQMQTWATNVRFQNKNTSQLVEPTSSSKQQERPPQQVHYVVTHLHAEESGRHKHRQQQQLCGFASTNNQSMFTSVGTFRWLLDLVTKINNNNNHNTTVYLNDSLTLLAKTKTRYSVIPEILSADRCS